MTKANTAEPLLDRWRISVRGVVQGVGFRPFVYRQAMGLGLSGWVGNSPEGVEIEAEGAPLLLERLISALRHQAPPNARVDDIRAVPVVRSGAFRAFSIRESQTRGETAVQLPADWAPCPHCLQELKDPDNRRYRYPFINCTDCGPRYSLMEALPYDRANTAMRHFQMCRRCLAEYQDPASRRFHAEATACPDCGPRLSFCGPDGDVVAQDEAALTEAVEALSAGKILALKGLGGYQLMVDARNARAVQTLRVRKQRPDKPLAVMFGSLEALQRIRRVSSAERQLLTGQERPIVLLRMRSHGLADNLAPRLSELGVMLPSTPLHELLLGELGFPVVATSGNRNREPIAFDNEDARARLGDIADGFLIHDRPIVRPLDDSVARVTAGHPQLLRRARGYSPNLALPLPIAPGWGATGGHLKTTVALSTDSGVVLSPHLGDMDSALGRANFDRTIGSLQILFATRPQCWAHDRHPDYFTTGRALALGSTHCAVQHHVAHIAAVIAEHGLHEPVLGVAWDGSGFGDDDTLWGGEFLRLDSRGYQRLAHMRPFRLPGGEAAMREPRRSAIGLLHALKGEGLIEWESLPPVSDFARAERRLLVQALKAGVNAPQTSSVGRLFDAVAALAGICQKASYEGQAAAELEASIDREGTPQRYRFGLSAPDTDCPWQVDWGPAIEGVLADIARGASVSDIATAFHAGLVDVIIRVAEQFQLSHIVLGGGCFQNSYLLDSAIRNLQDEGFQVFWPCQVPINDGGLALGQLAWAARLNQRGEATCAWPYRDA